ncbi:MAG: hypothetical protein M3347_08390, partial [Armatimonadota bacterium]|nr:hypothetical protein [Armatimonadota bacterium]
PTKPPFLGWRGNENLWIDIFSYTSRPNRIETVDLKLQNFFFQNQYNPNYGYNPYQNEEQASGPTGTLLKELGRIPQLKTPPVSYIAWFLALYVFFLVPVNYCVLRYFDKRELAWITVPIIVIVFSVMSYAAALRIKGSTLIARQVNIVQGTSDSGIARADAMLWLFSPRKTNYSVSSTESDMIAGDYILAKEEVSPSVVVREPAVGNAFAVEQALIHMWDWRAFVGHSVVNVGRGISVRLNGKQPVINNNTPFELRGVVLVTGGKVRGYENIKANATGSTPKFSDNLDLNNPADVGRILRASNLESLFPPTTHDTSGNESLRNTAQVALNTALGSEFGKSNPGGLLVAWSDAPAAALTVQDADPASRFVTLFVFRLADTELGHAALPSGPRDGMARRGATVQLVGFEPLDTAVESVAGSLQTYDCDLGDWGKTGAGRWTMLNIRVRGGGWNPGSYDPWEMQRLYRRRSLLRRGNTRWNPPPPAAKAGDPARFEVWDFKRNRWQRLSSRAPIQRGGQGTWEFKADLRGSTVSNFVRQPDNVVRLRLRTARAAVQVNSLQVQGTAKH